MHIDRLAFATALLSCWGVLSQPLPAQDEAAKPQQGGVILGLVVDGDRILIELDGDRYEASANGEKLDAARIQRHGNVLIVKDRESNPVAHVRIMSRGGNIVRIPRSDKATIGIELNPLSQALADHLDLDPDAVIYVSRAIAGRAAAKAGMHDHDVIIRIDGKSPVNEELLRNVLAGKKPGDEVEVRVIRRGKEKDLTIKCERARADELSPLSVFLDTSARNLAQAPGFFEFESPHYNSAINSLDLLQKNMAKTKAYNQYLKQLEEARESLRKAQQDAARNHAQFWPLYGNPDTGRQETGFQFLSPEATDNLLLHGWYDTAKSGASTPRPKAKGSGDVDEKLQGLEERFDRLEKMLEKLLDRKKHD